MFRQSVQNSPSSSEVSPDVGGDVPHQLVWSTCQIWHRGDASCCQNKKSQSKYKADLIKCRDHYACENEKSDLRQQNVFHFMMDKTVRCTSKANKIQTKTEKKREKNTKTIIDKTRLTAFSALSSSSAGALTRKSVKETTQVSNCTVSLRTKSQERQRNDNIAFQKKEHNGTQLQK